MTHSRYRFAGLIAGLAIAVMGAAQAGAQTVEWKLQSFIAPGNNQWDGYLAPFVEALKAKTNGRFNITLYPAGAIVPNTELSKAVAAGIVQAGHATATFDTGTVPASYFLAGLPFSFENAKQQVEFWFNYKNGEAFNLLNASYNKAGVEVISILSVASPLVFELKFPVAKVEDFAGKKIRAAPAFGDVVKALGAQQVSLPLGDVFTGLQTGLIDGTLLSIPALETFKIKDVVKYVVEKPSVLAVSEGDIRVNLAAWKALPDDLRKAFIEVARDTNVNKYIAYTEAEDAKVRKATDGPLTYSSLTGGEAAKFAKAGAGTWQKAEGLSAENKQLMALLKDYLKSKGASFPSD